MSHTLRTARIKAGLSIAELARRAGVTQRTIYRLEAAETRPLLDTVLALETALDLKHGALHFGPDAVTSASGSDAAERRGKERRQGGRRRANREHAPDRRKEPR